MKKTMFTMNDVLAAANKQVAQLMERGYMICFGDSSFGYAFRVDLENNGKYVRVKVEETCGFGKLGTVTLTVMEIPSPDGFERDDAVIWYEKVWYIVSDKDASCGRWQRDHVLTDSKDESETIVEKRRARRNAQRISRTSDELTPSASLIRALKSHKGFSNATRNTIMVLRVNGGYEISLKARDGHISRKEVIHFPKH